MTHTNDFTSEEIRVLKEFAQDKLYSDKIFKKDKYGKPIPRGSYGDWAKAMRKGGNKDE